jgi:tRNA(adenine34) deaminase
MHKTRAKRRWVQEVTTIFTAPPPGTFTRSAGEIARIMARADVSPKGLGSGIRMIQYFINRAGKHLTPSRRKELERAKRILQRELAARKSGAGRTGAHDVAQVDFR